MNRLERLIKGKHREPAKIAQEKLSAAKRNATDSQTANIMDIAPTVLHLLGFKVPIHMDGRLLKEILN